MRGIAFIRPAATAGILVVAGLGVMGAVPLTQTENVEFGPPIHDDASLDANVNTLAKTIAWKNAPGSDAFQVADAVISDDDFDAVKLTQLAAVPDEESRQ